MERGDKEIVLDDRTTVCVLLCYVWRIISSSACKGTTGCCYRGKAGWGGGTQQVLYGEAVPQGSLPHILWAIIECNPAPDNKHRGRPHNQGNSSYSLWTVVWVLLLLLQVHSWRKDEEDKDKILMSPLKENIKIKISNSQIILDLVHILKNSCAMWISLSASGGWRNFVSACSQFN